MNLTDWLDKRGLTQDVFAGRIGMTQGAISKIARGKLWPSPSTICEIERETRGAVTASDLYATYQAARLPVRRGRRRPVTASAAE